MTLKTWLFLETVTLVLLQSKGRECAPIQLSDAYLFDQAWLVVNPHSLFPPTHSRDTWLEWSTVDEYLIGWDRECSHLNMGWSQGHRLSEEQEKW